jgi:hypothetical protein
MVTYIATADIQDGMILAEDIKNRQGYLMLSKGVHLKDSHKKTLQTWNIAGVLIDTDEVEVEISSELLTATKEKLESLMDWECSLPIELDLFDTSIKKIAKDELSRTK